MRKTQVLIVGAGPSGMVSALALANSGIDSIVVEKRSAPGKHPKAHEISGRTIEILMSLGISLRDLRSEASPHEDASRIIFCRTVKEEIGRIDLRDPRIQSKYQKHLAHDPYFNLSQVELERILRRHLQKNKRITLLSDCSWKSCTQTEALVQSTLVHRGNPLKIESNYLLGCEGAGGAVRLALGISMDGPEQIQDFANVYFTNDLTGILPTPAKLFFIMHPGAAGTLIAHHPKRRWVYHVPVLSPHERVEDYTESRFRERLRLALGMPDFEPTIESISSWRMTAQVANSFRAGRAFLIGDTAHRFPPTGGLGLNSGVADAYNLCWKLAMVIKGTAHPKLLETYESERKPVIEINCRESLKNFQNLLKIPKTLGLDARYATLLSRILQAPPFRWIGRGLKDSLLKRMMQFADLRLQKSLKQAHRLEITTKAIQREIGHFDRIGLDLGFQYSTGAIAMDISPVEPQRTMYQSQVSQGTEYVPGFAPGQRLPHFYLKGIGKQKVGSEIHGLLSYTRFTLLCEDLRTWKRILTRQRLDQLIQIQVLGEIDLAGERISWAKAANVSRNGAILIRPDGQIAARFANQEIFVASFKHLMDVLALKTTQRRMAA